MFTGIIETFGEITNINKNGSNLHFHVKSSITNELQIDQSVAHNGVCLTVVAIEKDVYEVVAIDETLQKTNLSKLKVGDKVNLERCMQMNARLDGHIVQGHVDAMATCIAKESKDGSFLFTFQYQASFNHLIVEKGSICVNGVSLTAFNVDNETFSVAIIPYTFEHTTFNQLKVNDEVNLEFDIIGKYVARMRQI